MIFKKLHQLFEQFVKFLKTFRTVIVAKVSVFLCLHTESRQLLMLNGLRLRWKSHIVIMRKCSLKGNHDVLTQNARKRVIVI